jgi:hypothetical protein
MTLETVEGQGFRIVHLGDRQDPTIIASFFNWGSTVKVGGDHIPPLLGDFCLLCPFEQLMQEVLND